MLTVIKTNNGIKISNGDKSINISKAENGFITIVGKDDEEHVIWVPFVAFSAKARKRVHEVLKNFDGETKFDFSHTRTKLSEEQQKQIKDVFSNVTKEYDFKPVAQIEIASETTVGSLGCCSSGKDASLVSLSPQMFNGKMSLERWKDSVDSGFHPKGTEQDMVKSVLMHELGHSITVNSNNEKFWSKIEDIRKDYLKNIKKDDKQNVDFISDYARTNREEFVAEAFCQGKIAKTFGKYTRQIMEQIDKHFKKGYQHSLFNKANNAEPDDKDDLWIEGMGFGYPIDEKALEDARKKMSSQEKQD